MYNYAYTYTYDYTDTYDYKYTYITDEGDVDIESRNVHYVAVTRPKDELYFLIHE